MKEFYQRHLPHYQSPGATYFVTFRLKDSLPKEVLAQLLEEREIEKRVIQQTKSKEEQLIKFFEFQKKYFGHFDEFLDRASDGPFWLKNPGIASITSEAIHFRDSKMYDLLAFCIMPNHIHMVFELLRGLSDASHVGRRDSSPYIVTNIVENLKWYTALEANRALGRRGAFWQHESYDHVIRDDNELQTFIRYVIENPVKAGLVQHWRDWKWTYVKKSLTSKLEL